MGEHVRSVWRALDEVGLDVGIVDIYGAQGNSDQEFSAKFGPLMVDRLGDGTNIFCINGDEIDQALRHMRNRNPIAPGSRNIIYPAWELERYPQEWAEELDRFDEVWAPSAFIQQAIAKVVDIPVRHMPLACEVQRRGLVSRRHFGIRESAYTFLFAFDFLSYVERKNPFAVIEAFTKLVAERPHDDIVLLLKTNNSAQRPEMKSRFDEALEGLREQVVVIDKTLGELEMKGLIWLCDCFVSLHRSEGFGRGLSEAMALAKPVIATAYSGNMDFCSEDTAFLVPYSLIPLSPDDYPHWEDQHWADPDIDSALVHMRYLVDNPEAGRTVGRLARERLLAAFGYLPVGLRYAESLPPG